MKQELTGASVVAIIKSLLQHIFSFQDLLQYSNSSVYFVEELGRLSYEISNVIQGLFNRFALSLTSCPSANVLDRMTEFLQKTELLDSFADKTSQTVDIPTTIESEGEIGFKNATFSWSVKSPDHDGSSTPSQRTFRLHISGEQMFKRDCINLIVGST
jgi:hypothetical protein